MRLTVFTPTYNRRNLLPRVYESLCSQTCKDFTWLIVDDGSSDHTDELVGEYLQEEKLHIVYAYFENGGKMRAHNRGVELCDTELFLCLDSDDWLVPTAVQDIYDCIPALSKKDPISGKLPAGIVAHKGKSETEPLYDVDFPKGEYSTLYGLYLQGFKGETTLVFKTDVLREYPFPEIDGEKYVPEDYVYDKIDFVYTLFILPKIITVCELVAEGYTDSVRALKINNPRAWYLYYEQRARITPFSLLKFKYLGFYICYAKRCREPLWKRGTISPICVLAGYPFYLALRLTGKE